MKDRRIDLLETYYPAFFQTVNRANISNMLVEADKDTLMILKDLLLLFYDDKASLNSSDVLYIDSDPITIEISRYIKDFVSFKPDRLKYRFVIIMNLEKLTAEAANALLKSFEESKDYIVFLSFTSNSHKILKTILSRALIFKLNPIAIKDFEIDDKLLKYFNGSLGRYIIYKQEPIELISPTTLEETSKMFVQSFQNDSLYFIKRSLSFDQFFNFDILNLFLSLMDKSAKLPSHIKTFMISYLLERLVGMNYKYLKFATQMKQNIELHVNFSTSLLLVLNKLFLSEALYA